MMSCAYVVMSSSIRTVSLAPRPGLLLVLELGLDLEEEGGEGVEMVAERARQKLLLGRAPVGVFKPLREGLVLSLGVAASNSAIFESRV